MRNYAKTWILLVYTVPAQPTRKRALVWRELKKIGAIYLRDGVAVLPQRTETLGAFSALAVKIADMGGSATVVTNAAIEPNAEDAVLAESRMARVAEYAEIAREATALLDHLQREAPHRELHLRELDALDMDVGKLRRWVDQVE